MVSNVSKMSTEPILSEPKAQSIMPKEKVEDEVVSKFVDLSLLPDNEDIFPGLECLDNINSVIITPDKTWYIEYRPFGFTIDDAQGKRLLEAKPADSNYMCSSGRSLALLDLAENPILALTTNPIYCCGFFKVRESKISIPCKSEIGSVTRKQESNICNRGYEIKYNVSFDEQLTFTVEVVALPPEIRILMNDQVIAKQIVDRHGFKGFSKLIFAKEDMSPNLKAVFILFAISRHIFILENVNTCSCTCYVCIASALGVGGCLGII